MSRLAPAAATPSARPLGEYALCAGVIAGFGWCLWYLAVYRHLPQPFFYDLWDTFGDWFNTVYWSHQRGLYSVWFDVYPPLPSVLVNLVTPPLCYTHEVTGRDCDHGSVVIMLALYGANIVVLGRMLRRLVPHAAVPRTLAFAVGLPLLFTLERGNLLLLAVPLVLLAFTPLPSAAPAARPGLGGAGRALALALALNIKPNFLPLLAAPVVRRQWRLLEWSMLMTAAVYCLSFGWLGQGWLGDLYANIVTFSASVGTNVFARLYSMTGFLPLTTFDQFHVPVRDLLGSPLAEGLAAAAWVLTALALAGVALAMAVAWLWPRQVSETRLAALAYGLYVFYASPGTYYLGLFVALVFCEARATWSVRLAVTAAFGLCLPCDWVLGVFYDRPVNVWLTGAQVQAAVGLSVGMFARPLLVLLVLGGLCFDTLAQAWAVRRAVGPLPGLGDAGMAWAGTGQAAHGATGMVES